MQKVTFEGEYIYRDGKERETASFTETLEMPIATRGEMLAQARRDLPKILKKKDPKYTFLRLCDLAEDQTVRMVHQKEKDPSPILNDEPVVAVTQAEAMEPEPEDGAIVEIVPKRGGKKTLTQKTIKD